MSEFTSLTRTHLGKDMHTLVSVQMPVFNGEKYLAEAVDSILSQTFSDFEFLILDDGSTDDSLKLLQKYAAMDSRVHVITRENRGLSATQYELVQLSRGEFIAQLDQDDIALPNRLELQLDFFRKNSEVVALGGASQMIDGAGRYLTTLTMPETDKEIQELHLKGICAIAHSSVMMRSAALKSVGSYDKSYNSAADIDLWLRLGEIGKLANLKDVLLKYRLHNKSTSEKAGQQQLQEMRRACESAWSRRNVTGVFSSQLWRPGPDSASQHAFKLQYGWWAWNSRQRKTAAFYGWQAIRVKPFSISGWKLLIVALFKPLVNAETA